MEHPDIHEAIEAIEAALERDDLDSADLWLDDLETIPLPSTERGRAFALRVTHLDRAGYPEEVTPLIVETMQEEGDDLAFVSAAGMQFSELDAFEHAEMFLRNLLELEPENPVPPYNLAVALGREGRFTECIDLYDEALRRDSEFWPAQAQKAFCLHQLDRLPEAVETYRTYLAANPQDGDTWTALAELHGESGDLKAAYKAYEDAAEFSEDPRPHLFQCAQLAEANEDAETVHRSAERLKVIEPQGWRTLIAEAMYLELIDDPVSSWEAYRDALDEAAEAEDDDGVDISLASIFLFAADHEMAEEIGDYVSRAFDEDRLTETVLGALQLLEGRPSRAATSFQVVLRTRASEPQDNGEEPELQFRIYGVTAETADAAILAAKNFERRCTSLSWEIDSAQRISEPAQGHLGVYWRSPLMDHAPGPANPEQIATEDIPPFSEEEG